MPLQYPAVIIFKTMCTHSYIHCYSLSHTPHKETYQPDVYMYVCEHQTQENISTSFVLFFVVLSPDTFGSLRSTSVFVFVHSCLLCFPLPPPPMLYLCLFFLSVLDACFYPLQQYSGVAVAKRVSAVFVPFFFA